MDIRKIFEYALPREYEGKRFFEMNASRLSHAVAAGAFMNLAEEEQRHIEFIQDQINALDSGNEPSLALGESLADKGFFSQRATSEKVDSTVLEAMIPDLPVLRMAYLIEHDFAEFYERSAEKADGTPKKVLQMLAAWERGHERLFKNMHDQAFELYSNMPWGG